MVLMSPDKRPSENLLPDEGRLPRCEALMVEVREAVKPMNSFESAMYALDKFEDLAASLERDNAALREAARHYVDHMRPYMEDKDCLVCANLVALLGPRK